MKYIIDPNTNNKYRLSSVEGLSIYNQLSKQIQQLIGGSDESSSQSELTSCFLSSPPRRNGTVVKGL